MSRFSVAVAASLLLLTLTRAVTSGPSPARVLKIERTVQFRASTDTSPVDVRFGARIYSIPRNYLVSVMQPRGVGNYASFTLQVLLPDFAPRTSKNAAQLDRTGWHDQLRALFEYGKVPRPKEELLQFYLRNAKHSADDFELIGGKYKLYFLPRNSPREIYTMDTPHGLFLFTCNRKGDYGLVVTPSCDVVEDLGGNVGVIYHFGRDHLMEASDIDTRLRSLLRSFVAKWR